MYATVEFVGDTLTLTTTVEIGEVWHFDDRTELHEMAVEWAAERIRQHYCLHIRIKDFVTNVTIPNDEEKA